MTAKPVPEHISDERLAEMLAAAEKATPGPRERHVIDASTYRYLEDAEKAVARDQADADFNALCDPQTITALLTELQHRREAEATWRPWGGGKQPLANDDIVDYRLRSGIEGHNTAGVLFWHHDGRWEDIVAYRAAPPSFPASVKALEWEDRSTVNADGEHHDEGTDLRATTSIGTYYIGFDFFHRTPFQLNVPFLPSYEHFSRIEAAKARAEELHQAAILSALGEHP